MTQQLNKMTLAEALEIFGFTAGNTITKRFIMYKFRKLALQHHPDKGGDAKKLSKVVEAKKVLLRDFDSIAMIDEKGKPVKSVGSVFVDFLKTANTKNIKNPFTIYRKGRTKNV